MVAKKKNFTRKQATKRTPSVKRKSRKKKTILSKTRKTRQELVDLYDQYFPEKKNALSARDHDLLKQHSMLKLQVELVPGSCFWSNVRSNVTRRQWDKIRHAVYQKANHTCEICGGQGTKHPVECHEVWIYDDSNLTQRLGFFQAICPLCHEVKHIGLAGVRGNGERATTRFMEVNGLNKETADNILSAVWKQWSLRSTQQWTLNIDHLNEHGLNPQELRDRYRRSQVRLGKGTRSYDSW